MCRRYKQCAHQCYLGDATGRTADCLKKKIVELILWGLCLHSGVGCHYIHDFHKHLVFYCRTKQFFYLKTRPLSCLDVDIRVHISSSGSSSTLIELPRYLKCFTLSTLLFLNERFKLESILILPVTTHFILDTISVSPLRQLTL